MRAFTVCYGDILLAFFLNSDHFVVGPEGNHGEDVKENYYYLDSTPTHSYMKALYKYPQNSYPYADIVQQNRQRNLDAPEYEVDNTGAFDQNKYWDVAAEYAKEGPNHILCKITGMHIDRRPALFV